jgi:L-alanine-DL-glutamate epimerase-like enolase superfamily enzyme
MNLNVKCSSSLLVQERIERFDQFHVDLLKEPIQWEAGCNIPATKPGLGVELDEQVAAAHAYDGSVFIEVENRPV